MRTLDVLYNSRLSGTFPNQSAISATSPTAKDGTPYNASNIDDLQIGWIQALFDKLGESPNGIAESAGASQIVDLLTNLGDYRPEITLASSGTVDPGGFSRQYIIDTSLGTNTQTIGTPDFPGQRVDFTVSGLGLAYVKGPGLYAGVSDLGVPISEWVFEAEPPFPTDLIPPFTLHLIGGATEWRPMNEVTAHFYDNVNYFRVKQSSLGWMEMDREESSGGMITSYGSVYTSGISSFTFPVSFRYIHEVSISGFPGAFNSETCWAGGASDVELTGHSIRVFSPASTPQAGRHAVAYKGFY